MSLYTKPKKRLPRLGLFLTFAFILLLAAAAIMIAVVSTILSDESAESDKLRTITYGLTLRPSGFDPHIHSASEIGIVLTGVYDTLVYRHPTSGSFVGGLAERWTVDDGGRSYTFFLRQGVNFHDGTAFDASAVAVTLDRITSPELGSSKALALLGPYVDYNIIDTYTIELLLSEPYAPFLDALSQPYLGIASPTALANNNDSTYQFHQVGTGPFEMVEFLPRNRIVLERNPDYTWGPIFYAPFDVNTSVERIIFRFYEAPETRRIALEAGDADIIGELPSTDALLLLENQNFEIYQQPVPGNPLQFYFNTQNFPTDDLRFRQALISATNRESINGLIFFDQFSDAAYGPLSSATTFYSDNYNQYIYSVDTATIGLNQAGVSDSDDDGFVEKNGIPFELRIVFMGYGSLPEVAQLLQSQWLELGIQVDLVQVAAFPDLMAVIESGDYHLLAFNEFSTEASILNRYFLSTGDRNWTGYADAELDQWLIEATQAQESSRRATLYAQAQARIMQQALVLPIREYTNVVGHSVRLDGLIYFENGWWPLLPNLVIEG